MQTERGKGTADMPEQIPDSPENIMRAVLSTPPRKSGEWKFMQERKQRKEAN